MGSRRTEPQGLSTWREEITQEAIVYFDHIVGLLPGRKVRYFAADQTQAGGMEGWDVSDKLLLIEQGRIQLARQRTDLENIRQRAQFLFATALGAIGLATVGFPALATQFWSLTAWALGLLLLVVALLGSAGVVVAKKMLSEIHTTLLSRQASPLHSSLAVAYAKSMSQGENIVATQITVFRDAVFFLIAGLLLVGVSWLAYM